MSTMRSNSAWPRHDLARRRSIFADTRGGPPKRSARTLGGASSVRGPQNRFFTSGDFSSKSRRPAPVSVKPPLNYQIASGAD